MHRHRQRIRRQGPEQYIWKILGSARAHILRFTIQQKNPAEFFSQKKKLAD
jgi:hypothetical protein